MADQAMQQQQFGSGSVAQDPQTQQGGAQGGSLQAAGDAAARRMAGPQVVPNAGTLPNIDSDVKLTPPIIAAYGILQPYLPAGARMTSGLRTDDDQARVINNYFVQKGGPPTIVDVEQRRQWLIQKGMVIAAVGSSPHRTGLAFDLSGAPLDAIQAAVTQCHNEHPEFLFKDTILEHANSCLHVDLTG